MFKKLNLRITLSVLVTLATCCVSIYLISVTGIWSVLNTHYSNMVMQILEQKTGNLALFKQTIEKISSQMSNSEEIKYILTYNGATTGLDADPSSEGQINISRIISDLTLEIDGKILPYRSILGAAIFSSVNNLTLSSSGLSNYSWSILSNDPGIQSFTLSDQVSYWSVRSENMPDYYRSNSYVKQNGIVSFIQKIFDKKDQLLGYAVIDIHPDYFINFFKTLPDNQLLSGTHVSLIGSDGRMVPSTDTSLYESYQHKQGLVASDNETHYFIYPLSDTGIRFGFSVPSTYLKNDQYNVLIVSTLIIVGAIIFSIIIAYLISRSIVKPIQKLHSAMQNHSGNYR